MKHGSHDPGIIEPFIETTRTAARGQTNSRSDTMGRGTQSKSDQTNGSSRPTNGNSNVHVNDNDTKKTAKKKRHVTFQLSAEKSPPSASKNGDAGTMALRPPPTALSKSTSTTTATSTVRPKQTRFQTFLLLSALFITLPRMLYRITNRYGDTNEEECRHRRESFPGGILFRRMSSMAVNSLSGRFMPGKSKGDDPTGDPDVSAFSSHGSEGESSTSSPPSTSEDDSKRGIIRRVVERHRRMRKERRPSKSKSPIHGDELLHRPHPVRHVLEGASVYSHWKKRQQHQHQQHQQQPHLATMENIPIDWKTWKYAMSDDFDLTSQQMGLIKELAERVLLASKHQYTTQDIVDGKAIPPLDNTTIVVDTKSFSERVDSVPWGGVYNQEFTTWWPRKDERKYLGFAGGSTTQVLTRTEGGRLLAAYLKIMKWPKDLHAKFPFKLCSKGCNSEIAVLHTLEWREKYLPWCMSPDSIQYNKDGFIYHRGHSRPGPQQRLEAERTKDMTYFNHAGHSMVWYRPGRATLENPELYIRALIHTLEASVADSLLRNRGEIGRFNLVLDCSGIGTRSIPGMSYVKKLFAFLQDHFPDRLGVLLLANLSGVGRMVMNMVLPFVTDEVKAKIHVVPVDEEKRKQMLTQFIDLEHVPEWVGGKDDYIFDIHDYYYGSVGGSDKCILSEDKIREYLVTMPYHA